MKPKTIYEIGEHIFDYFVLSFLVNISLFLLIPFTPIYMGVVSYILDEDKSLRKIFAYIKENIKVIVSISIFILLIFVVCYINVFALQPQDSLLYYFIQVLSYILLFVGTIVFVYSPTIIYYMNVTAKQAIFNSLLLVLYNPFKAIVIIGVVIGFIYIGTHSIIFIILGQYMVIFAISKMIKTTILRIKERSK